ncbi:MAG: hypothetical protein ABMA64_18010 [Myxococcota bacterium]
MTPDEPTAAEVRPAPAQAPPLSVFAVFQARATVDDLVSTNPLLDGQVVGRLGGTNGIVVSPDRPGAYTEQRFAPFLTWTPPVADGRASLTAAFEIDFAYGDRAYGIGGNTGGGFGADQVNLQTRRLHATFSPLRGDHELRVVVGLQFVNDSAVDPAASTAETLLHSGGRLAWFGSEAAGITAYGVARDDWGLRLRYKVGTYTLLEQGSSLPDDVWLSMADVEVHPVPRAAVGGHLWYAQDRSGASGTLPVGPTGATWTLQGGPSLDPYDGFERPPDAAIDSDVVWVGADAGYNAALDRGPLGVHGFALGNFGKIYAPVVHDDAIAGFAADAEVRFRYARGDGSLVRAEAVFSSADDADPQRYTGVVTGNAYGIAAAPMPTLGTVLLFPDARAINRMVAVVSDLSGAGRGVVGVASSAGFDVVPNRIGVTGTLATAATADGEPWGTELGGRATARPFLGCETSVRAAMVWPGSAAALGGRPWTVSAALDWLLF